MQDAPHRSSPTAPIWLAGGGELGEFIRAKDWSQTPLGAVESWPQSLRTAVSMMLPSRAQIILFWGPERVVLYNDAYAPVLALKHPWALGRPGREAWAEVWNVLDPLLNGVIDTGNAFGASDHPFVLARRGYAEETYFDISYDPVRDETGNVAGIYCIVSETTGRVIGERRLRMLRDLGKAMGDAHSMDEVYSHGGSVLAEAAKDIAFAILYAWDDEKRVARRITAVNVPPTASWAPELLDGDGPWPIEDALASGSCVLEGAALDAMGIFPGGAWPESPRHVAISSLDVPGEGPKGILILGTSPRRPFDETYRDYVRLVSASFASALANARTMEGARQRAEMLAQVDRAKTAFFSNVSHEFRTPLTLLLAPLQDALTASDPASPAVRGGLETAHRNALRLQKLVNTLLDFSRIEAGRVEATYEAVDLAQATAELAANFRSACQKAGLALDVRCAPLAEPVWVDRDMWERVVLNLVSNAFKFTFEGRIEVRLEEGAEGPVFTVADTGAGIAAEHLPRLFDRFHRIEGVRARTHEGSGIGLALVHELVALHGGKIEVESAPGRGSAFRISLRYGTAHLPRDRLGQGREAAAEALPAKAFIEEMMSWLEGADDSTAPAARPMKPGPLQEAARILVADDNADMRGYIARLLREHWDVETATDGADALARLRERRFELVISDVMMPRLDGFGLLQAIRTDPALATTPIILLSARAGEEARIEGLDAGADAYLVKPFAARELTAHVGALLFVDRMRKAAAVERELLLGAERAARAEVRLEHERLVALFTQTPNPIVIMRGPHHVIELANPAACGIWGRKLEDVIGKPLLQALPEIKGQGFDQLLEQVFTTGVPHFGREMPASLDRMGNGVLETIHFNFVYTPMKSAEGEVEGVLVSAFDVSEEVRARHMLEELRGKAEEANRTKDAFLAMLGHELRNPLSPIVSALKVLRMRGVQRPELDIVERQAGHLTRLVDDLLDVSRITRGKLDLRKRLVQVPDIVSRALEIASPLIEERHIRVEVHMASQLPQVLGDPDRLAQVVSNLVANAAKYSNPGSIVLIECRQAGDCVTLAVQDEGVGIPAALQTHVFDLFFQQEQTIDRARGGLGLGLAIVRSIVEMHGGAVRVHSDGEGRGSRFTIEIPVAQGHVSERRLNAAPGGFRSNAHGSLRILIVDDNADAVATLGEALTLIGHEVQVAHDGEGGLAKAAEFVPDVALVDIGLPRMNGYELARRLRELPRPPGRLFAITGYGLDTDRRRALEAGFDRHFIKPVQVMDLDAAIAEPSDVEQFLATQGVSVKASTSSATS